MDSTETLLNHASLGSLRMQLISTDQGAGCLELLRIIKNFSETAEKSQLRLRSARGSHTADVDLLLTKGITEKFNEIEWKARYQGLLESKLDVDSVVGRLALSPTNGMWEETQGYSASPRHENLRLTFDGRRQWIESLGAKNYPSLLDILFFRRAKYFWPDLVHLVELILQSIERFSSNVIRGGCCDINSRGDDVLIKAGGRHVENLVDVLEAFHPVIFTSLELARRLKAAVPADYVQESRELSSSLAITLFAEHVAEDSSKRRTVLAASKK